MHQKHRWGFFLFLTLLLVMIRLPSLAEPLENDSGANAFLARQMLRGETLYDAFHPGHQLPGVYYTFELAFKLFGDHDNAPKLLLMPLMLVCALLLYRMGSMYFDEPTGIVTAVFLILISSQRGLAGMTVEMEHFANLPLIAGIFLLIILSRGPAPARQFIWLGVLSALSILYKVIFASPLIVAGIAILLMAWTTRSEIGVWKTMLSRLIWVTIGLVMPLAIVAAYFAGLGLWKRFILTFTFGFNYLHDTGLMNSSSLPPPFGFPLFWMSVNNIALLCFGLLGAFYLGRRSIPVRSTHHLTGMIAILWLVISLAIAGMRGGGYPHYVLPVVPPLSLLASIGIGEIYQRWKLSSEKLANLGRSALISLVVFLFLLSNYDLYREYARYRLSWISHGQFLQNVYYDGFASQQISSYLEAHTQPDDFVYLWSHHIDIYYYADRRPPLDVLWPSYVEATGPSSRVFHTRTKYIVVEIPKKGKPPQWLLDGLAANYELETVIEDSEIYRRRSQ